MRHHLRKLLSIVHVLVMVFGLLAFHQQAYASESYNDSELAMAVILGMGEYQPDDSAVTYTEFVTMLDRVIELADKTKLSAWQSQFPEARAATRTMTRFEGMVLVLKAAIALGSDYTEFNTDLREWFSMTVRIGESENDSIEAISNRDEYVSILWPFGSGKGFTNPETSPDVSEWHEQTVAHDYSYSRASLVSGKSLFDYDAAKDSMRPNEPLTYTEALLAAVRLLYSAESSLDHIPQNPNPKTIYVDASNARVGDGTQANPHQTITAAVNTALWSDTIIVADGVYHESVALPSGSADRPTTMRAADGAGPVLTPTIPFDADWDVYKGKIYMADVSADIVQAMDAESPQLFVEGVSMVEARYPNLPGADMSSVMDQVRAIAQRGTNSGAIVAPKKLPSGLQGATVVIWVGGDGSGGWWSLTSPVSSVSGQEIRLATPIEEPDHDSDQINFTPMPGNAFYVAGALPLLDAPGEFYYDREAGKLYFYAPDGESPSGLMLSLKARDAKATYLYNNTVMDGFAIYGGGISVMGSGNTIRNCVLRYAENTYKPSPDDPRGLSYEAEDAVTLSGAGNTVESCEISYTAGNGIYVSGPGHVITNNIIRGCNYMGGDLSSVHLEDAQFTEVSHNSMYDAGRAHVRFASDYHGYEEIPNPPFTNCDIHHNYFTQAMVLTSDGAAIYDMGGPDGGGTEIHHNFVEIGNKGDQGGMEKWVGGIYFDNFSSNFTAHHNIILGGQRKGAGGEDGLANNLPSTSIQFANNTVIGTNSGFGMCEHPDGRESPIKDLTLKDNLFVDINGIVMAYTYLDGGQWVTYTGIFDDARIGGVTSSGNVEGTVDSQYRPSGSTPATAGAIPPGYEIFEFGANWTLEN